MSEWDGGGDGGFASFIHLRVSFIVGREIRGKRRQQAIWQGSTCRGVVVVVVVVVVVAPADQLVAYSSRQWQEGKERWRPEQTRRWTATGTRHGDGVADQMAPSPRFR